MAEHSEVTEIDEELEELEELEAEFRIETLEGLTEVDELLLRPGPDAVSGQFRVFHSLKGIAGMLGFEDAAELCHATETTLGRVRDGELPLSDVEDEDEDEVFRAATTLRAMVDPPQEAGTPSAPDTLRVDVSRIDTLVELIGELVIVESMVGTQPDALTRLSKLTRELQRGCHGASDGPGPRPVPSDGATGPEPLGGDRQARAPRDPRRTRRAGPSGGRAAR
ncbi:MAG: hypothetical protein GY884_24980 [Proteobacteria bacterium]|nr:hypothetical protein [Pseudomonadota bacterium]